jgi:Domain of unknown function (DUF5666)
MGKQRATTMNRTSRMILIAAVVLLAGCNGPTETAGIQGSGIPVGTAAVGPITGFGSIFVNGVEYSTSGAQILIDGQPGTEAQLQTAQIVTVKGTVNADDTTGSATEVDFSGDVQGPVTHIDLIANSFVALGQTVQLTASTLLDPSIQPADLSGLQTGTVVEVSGFADASGAIVASRLDVKSATGTPFQVRGTVQGLDPTAHTFRINGLTVDHSAATVSGTIADGSSVEVHGTTVNSAGVLLAAQVEVLPGLGASANQYADIDGIITTFTSTTDFVVLGQHVMTDANTQFVLHGVTLAANLEVDVKGQFNASGMLVAQKVEVRPRSASSVRGPVDFVTASSNTLSVLGVHIVTSASTELDDRSNQHVRQFRLTDVHVGDYIEIDGTADQSGVLNASVVDRENGSTRSYLQGVASNLAQPNFTVLGVTVSTTAQTRFADPGGAASGAATFFSVALNHVVNVSGAYSGGVLTADQVQIEQ